MLKNIFNDPKRGLIGRDKLIKKFPHLKDEINKEYNALPIPQLYKQQRIKNYYSIYDVKAGHFQIDLIFIPYGTKYIIYFIAIDILPRQAFGLRIKNKTKQEKQRGITALFKAFEPYKITSDEEFRGMIKDIQHITYKSEDDHRKFAIIDRFVRTLKNMVNKYRLGTSDRFWFQKIPDIINNYNNTYHSGIKATPQEFAESPEKMNAYISEKINHNYNLMKSQALQVGDRVRHRTNKKEFQKEKNIFSKKIHEITQQRGITYILDNSKEYRGYDLQKIPEETETIHQPYKPNKKQTRTYKATKKELKSDLEKTRWRALATKKRIIKAPQKLNL